MGTLDRVMPTAPPPTELPDEYHIFSASRNGRSFDLSRAALGMGALPGETPRYRIFPSTNPSSRHEVLLLNEALGKMLQVSGGKWEAQADVYDLVLAELVRQVWVHCTERGQLLGRVRRAFARLVRIASERISQLEQTVRHLREDLSITDVAAARRIADLKALSLDSDHANRKAGLLARMRTQYRNEGAGLHHVVDAFDRLGPAEQIRAMHLLCATKLDRAQANLLTQALLSTLPRAESCSVVHEFIDEALSSEDVVQLLLPPATRAGVLLALGVACISAHGGAAAEAIKSRAKGEDKGLDARAHNAEQAGAGAGVDEAALCRHVYALADHAEAQSPGSARRLIAFLFERLPSNESRALALVAVGVVPELAAARAAVDVRVPRTLPGQAEAGAQQAPAPALGQQAAPGLDPGRRRTSLALREREALAQLPSAPMGQGAATSAAAEPPRVLHSIGPFALTGMLGQRGRTVDAIAEDVLRTAELLTLEETLRQCGELLAERLRANNQEDIAGQRRSTVPSLLDHWAFHTHKLRSRARTALATLAASVHHYGTFEQQAHPRIVSCARALGIGDGAPIRRGGPDAGGGTDGRGAEELLDDDDDDEPNHEPPTFNDRVFHFYTTVIAQLLPTPDLLSGAFASTEPVYVPCETRHGAEELSGVGVAPDVSARPELVDAFQIIEGLTELNELHFDATYDLVEKLRPSLSAMPIGAGVFSGVGLPLDLVVTELLDLYLELESERKARLKQLFRKHDENHDGVLDFDEFHALALDFNPNLSPRDISKLFVEVLNESEARRRRGIDDVDDLEDVHGKGGTEDVVSPEAFAEVVDRFSVEMFGTGGPH